jgi:hypothetical protein
MAREGKVNHEEFVALLESGVEVERNQGRAEYDRAEVVAAARELGLDGDLAAQRFDAFVARRARADLDPRPFDTPIALVVTPENFTLDVPPLRPSVRTIAPMIFALFFIGVTASVASEALKSSKLIGFGILPIAGAGVVLLLASLDAMVRRTRLTLDRSTGTLETRPFGRRRTLRTRELRVTIGPHPRYRPDPEAPQLLPPPVIKLEHGADTYVLLNGYSDQERGWIASELEHWLLRP